MKELKEKLNRLGGDNVPFLFIIDFDMKEPLVLPLADVDDERILYDINGFTNAKENRTNPENIVFEKTPVNHEEYAKAFRFIQGELEKGNTLLANLTFPTRLETNLRLRDFFDLASEKYRLLYDDRFVLFSPETFVIMENDTIRTFPMKGTIDAGIPGAAEIIMEDEKEHAEHVTIVDLMRNDLARVSKDVRVERFRYLTEITAKDRKLLQVSSEISGTLPSGWNRKLGDMLVGMLPAGSVSGAPKKKTVEILKKAEGYDRGFYTGVFGYYRDGYLESSVMIRFIEKTEGGLCYKSGGGITAYSDCGKEYKEMTDKVYVKIT
jgi:Anthranilate/para-aminobenzoate synthases component I